jgi:hypothetical protein
MPLIVVAGVVALVAIVLLGIAAAVAGRWSVYVDASLGIAGDVVGDEGDALSDAARAA